MFISLYVNVKMLDLHEFLTKIFLMLILKQCVMR